MTRETSARVTAVGVEGSECERMARALVEVAVEVFDTMIGKSLVPSGPPTINTPRPPATVVGTVGFAGSANGLVCFGTSRAAAVEITAAMLGLEASEVADDMPDAIGEVTNMITGSFRTRMAKEGNGWSITMPVVTVAEDMLVRYSSSAMRTVCPFTMGEHVVFVELVLQTE
jgi:chemotaxis protein CheX